ncbi:MAG TPA: PAS domain S-box protein [Kofleriaceae bacterium]|nr:PAS domain S-box protein [Kofleriaceae bacterium]
MSQVELPFRELVEAAPDGMIVCDHTGAILLVNAEASRMFGYTREELIGNRIDMLVPAAVRGHHGSHVASFTTAPRLRPMGSGLDLHGARKDGTEFPVEISLSPIQTSHGLMITAGIRDISERRHLEDEKRKATAYLTSAVDVIQDTFALFDERDRLVMVNSAGRQLFGRTFGSSIIGLPFATVLEQALGAGAFDFSNETRASFLERWLAYHRDPKGTLDVRTGTGRYLRVTERRTAEHGTVAMVTDVTDDVQHAEELGAAREVAEAASAAKSEFLSSMSHELRTPLNAILGFAQLLERDRKNPLDTRQLDRLKHVLRGGEHLLRLIDDVLDLSKIEAGGIAISVEPVGLETVLAEVVSTLEPMATRAQIRIAPAKLADDTPRVLADRTRLSQILMNFGSNAIKYGKQDGNVSFRVAARGRLLRITVVDDGIGIPESKRDKIFEPFQRAGQEAGPIEGTGIGLTISKRLAELMHGAVGFTSSEGQGSSFWIDIPIVQQVAPAATVTAPRTMTAEVATDGARHLVVYVEDNPSNIAFMRDLIEDLPGIELITAPTAEIGLELIRGRLPRLVIMDINLPGMSGFDAVAQLRGWPETRAIPVIGLSAAALVQDRKRAKDAGFDRYLTKPVKVAELTETLAELLA